MQLDPEVIGQRGNDVLPRIRAFDHSVREHQRAAGPGDLWESYLETPEVEAS
ncbi:MAG TPA: hypothetical protein VIL53_03000 [Solirubrobacterales bacterium]